MREFLRMNRNIRRILTAGVSLGALVGGASIAAAVTTPTAHPGKSSNTKTLHIGPIASPTPSPTPSPSPTPTAVSVSRTPQATPPSGSYSGVVAAGIPGPAVGDNVPSGQFTQTYAETAGKITNPTVNATATADVTAADFKIVAYNSHTAGADATVTAGVIQLVSANEGTAAANVAKAKGEISIKNNLSILATAAMTATTEGPAIGTSAHATINNGVLQGVLASEAAVANLDVAADKTLTIAAHATAIGHNVSTVNSTVHA